MISWWRIAKSSMSRLSFLAAYHGYYNVDVVLTDTSHLYGFRMCARYGLKVTSSEKVDSFGRYSKFKLVATPYPGVEFFQKFKANKYSARKLCFDWSQNFADAELQLPPGHADYLGIRWRDYKSWDLSMCLI